MHQGYVQHLCLLSFVLANWGQMAMDSSVISLLHWSLYMLLFSVSSYTKTYAIFPQNLIHYMFLYYTVVPYMPSICRFDEPSRIYSTLWNNSAYCHVHIPWWQLEVCIHKQKTQGDLLILATSYFLLQPPR